MNDIIKTVGNYKELVDEIITRQARIDELKKIENTTGLKGVFTTHLDLIITKAEEELALFVNKSLERIELEEKTFGKRQD